MKIVVIGGSGLIGSKLVAKLKAKGHDAIAASPGSGVNTITGEGLAEVLEGAQVVVDVANSPSFEDKAVLEFFTTAGRNLLAAEQKAGVGHHIAVSIVGTDRNPDSGYMRAKVAQEELIKSSPVPYTILRSTQFFEFLAGIINSSMEGDAIRLTPALIQPVSAEDLSTALVDIALARPANAIIEIGGPDRVPLDDLGRRYLAAHKDARPVVSDPQARYFGAVLEERSLVPLGDAIVTPTGFEDWLRQNPA